MRDLLLGGTHTGEWIEHDGCPFLRMLEKVRRPVFTYSHYDEIIQEKFKTETYVQRRFHFRHRGLLCLTQAYVLDGITDEEAARLLDTRDTQQDW